MPTVVNIDGTRYTESLSSVVDQANGSEFFPVTTYANPTGRTDYLNPDKITNIHEETV